LVVTNLVSVLIVSACNLVFRAIRRSCRSPMATI
jgi:hypothetical protein